MIHRRTLLMSTSGLAVALLAACGGGGDAPAPQPTAKAVLGNQLYTQTNEIDNTVLQFSRAADGTLTRLASVSTGGTGTNGLRINGTPGPNTLGSQFSVMTLPAERLLLQ